MNGTNIVAGIVFALGVAALILVFPLLGTALGALVGLIVGLFFDDTIATVWGAMGFAPVATWQLGAFFGFIGGFLKSVASNRNNSN